MNLRRLKRSQKWVSRGDVFVYQATDGADRYGLVHDVGVRFNGLPCSREGLILVYLYRTRCDESDGTHLPVSQLLIPPVVTGPWCWTKGYFVTRLHREIRADERLSREVFWDCLKGEFMDTQGNKTHRGHGPIGSFTLAFEGAISIDVSRALGLPYMKGVGADPIPASLAHFYDLERVKI